MKTVKQLYELIADKPETEVLFVPLFAKDEADEYIEENYEQEPFTEEEWATIANRMSCDDGLWQELMQCWNHYIEKAIMERNKGNDNSK